MQIAKSEFHSMDDGSGDRTIAESVVFRLVQRVILSDQTLMKWLRNLLLLMLVVLGLSSLRTAWRALVSSGIYRRDFLQEYVLGKALLYGYDLYLPLPVLVRALVTEKPLTLLPHPTPHPPPVAILSLPFALLSYPAASVVWLAMEVACVGLISWQLLTVFKNSISWRWVVILMCVLMGWRPFLEELLYGQLMVILLVVLLAAWRALRANRDILGGLMLGCVIAGKIIAWPIFIFLFMRKRWKSVLAAGFVIGALNLVVAFMTKLGWVLDYYLSVGPEIAKFYHSFAYNFSLWTVGWRLFEGTGSQVLLSLESPPVFSAPHIAPLVSWVLVTCFTLVTLVNVSKWQSFDLAFAALVCLSILVSPVSWIHYFTWLVLPLLVLFRCLWRLGLPGWESIISAALVIIISLPIYQIYYNALESLGYAVSASGVFKVSAAMGLLTYMQPICIVLLMLLVRRMEVLAHTKIGF